MRKEIEMLILLPSSRPEGHLQLWGPLLYTLMASASVFHCCIATFHRCNSLKEHTFMISLFLWVSSLAQPRWVLCSGSQRLQSECPLGLQSYPRLGVHL